MAHPANPPAPSPAPSLARDPARDPAANMNEVTALLLEVLRNVNREVETTLESESRTTRDLEGNALKAVLHFREISNSLRTPADGSVTYSGTATGTLAPPAPPR